MFFLVFITKYIFVDIGKVTESAAANTVDNGITAANSNGNGTSTPNNSPVYDYPTLKKREKLTTTVEEWLNFINMSQYLDRYFFLRT